MFARVLLTRKYGKSNDVIRAEAVVRRSSGTLMQLQMRVWKLFPEWYVTCAITKLVGRVNVVYRYFNNPSSLSEQEVEMAISWLDEQEQSLMTHISDAASITMRRPAKLGFLGFNTNTKQRRLEVTKQDEDDPPPWECFVKCDFRDYQLSREEIERLEAKHRKLLEGLRCQEHGHAAHVRMIGASHNFNFQIESCCDSFSRTVRRAINTINTST